MYSNGTPDTIIRFPGPGHTTFRDEKIVNEVQIMQFLEQKTTTPVPRLINWGLTEDNTQVFGPFIISDLVEGAHLSDMLKDPSDAKRLAYEPRLKQFLEAIERAEKIRGASNCHKSLSSLMRELPHHEREDQS